MATSDYNRRTSDAPKSAGEGVGTPPGGDDGNYTEKMFDAFYKRRKKKKKKKGIHTPPVNTKKY